MMQTLEAVIAILLIATVFIVFYQSLGTLPEFETISWKIIGFNTLKGLDKSMGLRQDVLTGNTSAISAKIANFIPVTVNYTVSICDVSCSQPNISASKIVSVSYIVAGFQSTYYPKQVIVYMWTS